MIARNDVTIRYTRGKGPGGQHKNKTDSCVVMTHNATGAQVRIDGRCRHRNERKAYRALDAKLRDLADQRKADVKKSRRDHAIQNETRIRTYDFTKGIVVDHRSGRKASIKNVLDKGKIELLR